MHQDEFLPPEVTVHGVMDCSELYSHYELLEKNCFVLFMLILYTGYLGTYRISKKSQMTVTVSSVKTYSSH